MFDQLHKSTHRTYDAHLHVSDNGQAPDHAKLATYLNRAYGATGHLDIKAPDGAHLSVDGADTGVAPLSDVVDVEEGAHKVASDGETRSVEAAGGQLVKVVFTGAANGAVATTANAGGTTTGTTTSQVQPSTSSSPPTATAASNAAWPPLGAWILGGVGVAGIGIGIGFAVAAGSKADAVNEANANGTCSGAAASSAACGAAMDAKDALSRDRLFEWLGLGIGAASLGVAVFWALRTHGQKDTVAILPDVGPNRSGLRFSSSF